MLSPPCFVLSFRGPCSMSSHFRPKHVASTSLLDTKCTKKGHAIFRVFYFFECPMYTSQVQRLHHLLRDPPGCLVDPMPSASGKNNIVETYASTTSSVKVCMATPRLKSLQRVSWKTLLIRVRAKYCIFTDIRVPTWSLLKWNIIQSFSLCCAVPMRPRQPPWTVCRVEQPHVWAPTPQ
jgi:hypothetical protein